jgi:hypothetical protein
MDATPISQDPAPAPESCTLSADELPARRAAFDALFADLVRRAERTTGTSLRLSLRPDAQAAARTAELMTAESACCGFFTFTLTAADGELALEIAVPAAQASTLDSMAARATTAAGLSP